MTRLIVRRGLNLQYPYIFTIEASQEMNFLVLEENYSQMFR